MRRCGHDRIGFLRMAAGVVVESQHARRDSSGVDGINEQRPIDHQRRRRGVGRLWRRRMETEHVELRLVDRCQRLKGASRVVELVERVVRTLYAGIEKVARIRILAVVGDFCIAAVQGEIGCRRREPGEVWLKQPVACLGKTEQLENIGWRAVQLRYPAHRVGQLMKCNANYRARIDVGREGRVAVDSRGVVGVDEAQSLRLGVPDHNARLALYR